MKVNKKFLSCFMAVAFSIGSISVYATDGGTTGSSGSDSSVVSVVLPTNIDFSIDPYGLSAMESSQSLEDLLKNPPGLVTSPATMIQNTGETGITVTGEVYLQSNLDLTLAKTETEAKAGKGDLYLELSPKENSLGWNPIPVTTLTTVGNSVSGAAFSFYLDKSDGSNPTYEFMIDGYANPQCELWEEMYKDSTNNTIQLTMKFTIVADEIPQESTESSSEEQSSSATEEATTTTGESVTTESSSSGGEKPSEEQTSTSSGSGEEPSTEEQTTADPMMNVVCGADGTFTLQLDKSKVSQTPAELYLIDKNGVAQDLYVYGIYEIVDGGSYYEISVEIFDYEVMSGTYRLQILDQNGTVIYDNASVTFE